MNGTVSGLQVSGLRVAWLLPTVFFYWQPALKSLAQVIPQTRVFTTRWFGLMPDDQTNLSVELVGQVKVLKLSQSANGYNQEFTYVSPGVIPPLLKYQPDVIFSNSFGVWTILALMFKFLGNWRVVIAYEGSSPGVDYRSSPLRLAMRRAMVRAADACITNSQAGQRYLTGVLHASPQAVFVQPYEVPDPTDLLQACTDDANGPSSAHAPTFLFVGHLVPRKGLHLLLQACALLQQQGCEHYRLMIVGDGEQREELEAFSEANGLGDRLQWIGRVEYGRLGTYFRQASVFVLPTLEDTWGVVVLCSQRAGAHELIHPGENGFVFDPEQPVVLAAYMRQLIDQPELCQRMGEQARQSIAHLTPATAGTFLAQVTEFVWNGSAPAHLST
jgi:glycosyltransferase involved in cell wall biosynthesis